MLSIDIETTGLSHLTSYATVACTHDGVQGKCYHLCKPASEGCTCTPEAVRGPPGEGRCDACRKAHSNAAAALFEALDTAHTICGFNCLRFDIPYLQGRFSLDNDRVGKWAAKTIDLFLLVSESFDVFCSLDRALNMNGLPRKTGTGAHAIEMARNEEWDKLADYCTEDARLTRSLTSLQRIRIPHGTGGGAGVVCIQKRDLQQNEGWTWYITPDAGVSRGTMPKPKRFRSLRGVRSLFGA